MARRTVARELVRSFRSSLKAAEPVGPASLTMIRTTTAVWDNHQMLAVFYDEGTTKGVAQIGRYAPQPSNRVPTIKMEFG